MTQFKTAENSVILIVVNSLLSGVARKARIAFAIMEKMDIMIVNAPKEMRAINCTKINLIQLVG
jgi:hypothetical protein